MLGAESSGVSLALERTSLGVAAAGAALRKRAFESEPSKRASSANIQCEQWDGGGKPQTRALKREPKGVHGWRQGGTRGIGRLAKCHGPKSTSRRKEMEMPDP